MKVKVKKAKIKHSDIDKIIECFSKYYCKIMAFSYYDMCYLIENDYEKYGNINMERIRLYLSIYGDVI